MVIIDVFSKDFLAQPFAFASDSQSPLFIVGMPRSGTTLTGEYIVQSSRHSHGRRAANHCRFYFTPVGIDRERGYPYPQAVKHITPAIATRLINDYEKRLRRDIGLEVPHVIDKNPLNFRQSGVHLDVVSEGANYPLYPSSLGYGSFQLFPAVSPAFGLFI